ncbi:hypothetical protein UACE39S_02269 [Ureibacillus acetophenoni]
MKKILATVSTLAIMGAAVVGGNAAFAAESTITGGTLSMEQPTIGNFNAVTLNGLVQSTTATVGSFKIVDPSGTGDGWNVVMKATPLQHATLVDEVLPENSLTIGEPTLTAAEGADDVLTIAKKGGAIDNTNGVKVLSAAVNGGMGTYTVGENTLTLDLQPKDVKAGKYSSTITVTITTGP